MEDGASYSPLKLEGTVMIVSRRKNYVSFIGRPEKKLLEPSQKSAGIAISSFCLSRWWMVMPRCRAAQVSFSVQLKHVKCNAIILAARQAGIIEGC